MLISFKGAFTGGRNVTEEAATSHSTGDQTHLLLSIFEKKDFLRLG
jgi:hypothetical protein